MLGGDEEFAVALGTLDRAFSMADHAPARERAEPARYAIADLGVAGTSGAGDLLRYLSTDVHFEGLAKGLVDTADLAYFALMIGIFLIMTRTAVESIRWR